MIAHVDCDRRAPFVKSLHGGQPEATRRPGDDGDASREIGWRCSRRDWGFCRGEDPSIWRAPAATANCANLLRCYTVQLY
jgi:hypothetical protein